SNSLGKIGRVAVPALTNAFRRGNERVRIGAVRALEAIGANAKPAAAVLVEALAPNSSAALRWEVVRALGAIPDPGAVNALADEVVSDPDYRIRGAAACS